MKDTCVVRVKTNLWARFYPNDNGGAARIPAWPPALREKFRGAGIYSIRRVARPSPRSVRVAIIGDNSFSVPARFVKGGVLGYGLCRRFLNELGIKGAPLIGKRKTLHLVVTKRRAKK